MKKALTDAGLSKAEIARRMGVTPQAVNGWFATGTIQKRNLVRFAKETGADLEALMGAEAGPKGGSMAAEFRHVPVIGFAIATPEEDGYFDDMGFPPGGGEGYVLWPTKDANAYALRVKGDSMQPRIRPGEVLVVQPATAVQPGHDVVVRTRDGRKMVKQLLYQRAGEVTLGSINQAHKQLTLSLEQIESMHYVAAIAPATSIKES